MATKLAELTAASSFQSGRDGAQLVHIATDGETHGHHHKYRGDGAGVCTAGHRAARRGSSDQLWRDAGASSADATAQIIETVELCAHGVERWASNCGCNSGGPAGISAGGLRAALDLLRDRLAPLYEQATSTLLIDPWQARDAYV